MRGKKETKKGDLNTEEATNEVNAAKISKSSKNKEKEKNLNESKEEVMPEINDAQSGFLADCKKAFGTINLYEILALDKSKAAKSDSELFLF